MRDSFWSRPDGCSIVDILALAFSGTYLSVIIIALFFPLHVNAAEIQANMNILMATILGGYFGDQVVKHWTEGAIQREKTKKSGDPTI